MLEKLNKLVNYTVDDKGYDWYDWLMIAVVLISLVPLTTHEEHAAFKYIDITVTVIFIIDYIIRWTAAKHTSRHKNWKAYVLYPLRLSAIVDLLSILPIFLYFMPMLKVLRSWRVIRLLRVGRLFRYYDPLQIILDVFRKKADVLLTVVCFAAFYILITALIMFNVEYGDNNHFFDSYWDAIYWATCTLTTVGYGDIYPVSAWGRAISMISALVGIAIIALPSGILTAGYMDEMNERKRKKEEEKEGKSEKNGA